MLVVVEHRTDDHPHRIQRRVGIGPVVAVCLGVGPVGVVRSAEAVAGDLLRGPDLQVGDAVARAGFRFVDEKGNDVFVALTMNNQKNQYTYALQFISRNGNNWSSKGLVADISGNRDIVAKANSAGGVPFAVLYADGQFTVWLNNERVASQVRPTDKEANIFADDAKVTAGLETWQYGASFTGLFIIGR